MPSFIFDIGRILKMSNKAEEIEKLLISVADSENIEIVDLQYVKENGSWVIRVFIDKEAGVSIDDCEKMSYLFGATLDAGDVLNDSYVLEVSSPGINRILKKEKDFEKFTGEKIRIRTFTPINNQKNFLGKLISFKDRKLKINDVTNGEVEIIFSDVEKANLETDI
ncbi:MAG: ribosome maturation factor RimP [Endomicrobium sp.]|jgi:ribosome maturation factor RimP|nr:ribosome maturation factor RimP [Endomicrobium sp.]